MAWGFNGFDLAIPDLNCRNDQNCIQTGKLGSTPLAPANEPWSTGRTKIAARGDSIDRGTVAGPSGRKQGGPGGAIRSPRLPSLTLRVREEQAGACGAVCSQAGAWEQVVIGCDPEGRGSGAGMAALSSLAFDSPRGRVNWGRSTLPASVAIVTRRLRFATGERWQFLGEGF